MIEYNIEYTYQLINKLIDYYFITFIYFETHRPIYLLICTSVLFTIGLSVILLYLIIKYIGLFNIVLLSLQTYTLGKFSILLLLLRIINL